MLTREILTNITSTINGNPVQYLITVHLRPVPPAVQQVVLAVDGKLSMITVPVVMAKHATPLIRIHFVVILQMQVVVLGQHPYKMQTAFYMVATTPVATHIIISM